MRKNASPILTEAKNREGGGSPLGSGGAADTRVKRVLGRAGLAANENGSHRASASREPLEPAQKSTLNSLGRTSLLAPGALGGANGG